MRDRQEIKDDQIPFDYNDHMVHVYNLSLILEVLLDIRELLQHPPLKNVSASPPFLYPLQDESKEEDHE